MPPISLTTNSFRRWCTLLQTEIWPNTRQLAIRMAGIRPRRIEWSLQDRGNRSAVRWPRWHNIIATCSSKISYRNSTNSINLTLNWSSSIISRTCKGKACPRPRSTYRLLRNSSIKRCFCSSKCSRPHRIYSTSSFINNKQLLSNTVKKSLQASELPIFTSAATSLTFHAEARDRWILARGSIMMSSTIRCKPSTWPQITAIA